MNQAQTFIQQLQEREPLPPLYPTKIWDADLSAQILASTQLSEAVRAGLLLWNDDLEASHTISQNIPNATGSLWHAIMHRRESDARNALYWCARISAHRAFDAIALQALKELEAFREKSGLANEFAGILEEKNTWQPEMFVTYCDDWPADADDSWLRRVQVAEIETLLNWCLEQRK